MGRIREFDEEEVLDKALELFWTKGYERTSVQDLCSHTGIHRGSLYDTFGDKHGLFLACLDRFRHQKLLGSFAILEEEGEPRELLERYFARMVDNVMDLDKQRRGCLVANAAMDTASYDAKVASRVEAGFLDEENLFYEFLLRAQKAGKLKSKHTLRELARFLVGTKQGLHVLGKTADDRKLLLDVCKVALGALFG